MNAPISPRLSAWLYVNLACLCWAGNLAAGRLLRDSIGPGVIVGMRSLLAAILLLMLMRLLGERKPEPPLFGPGRGKHLALLALMAATGIVGYQGLVYEGLRATGAFNAALINSCMPLATGLMAWAVIGTRLRPVEYAGIAISMAGVAVIASGGEWQRLLALNLGIGDALIFLAVILWGVFSLSARVVMKTRSVLSATTIATVMAVGLSAPWAVIDGLRHPVQWSPGVIGGLLYVALFASLVAFLAWNRAVQTVGPAQASAGMNILPLYALLVSVYVLGEPLHAYQIGGGALVIFGSALATLGPLWLVRNRAVA